MKDIEPMPTETKQAPLEEQTPQSGEQIPLPEALTPLPAKRVITKLVFLILLSAFPVWFCVMVCVAVVQTVYDIRVNLDGDAAPEEAARYEQAARDAIRPVLAEKYGLKVMLCRFHHQGVPICF